MEKQITVLDVQSFDMLKALFFARLARVKVDKLIVNNPDLPETTKNGSFRVIREIDTLERKLTNTLGDQSLWLSKELNKEKIWDISSASELIVRIGTEEKSEVYEEFLSMFMDCLNAILYAQVKRKNIHFGKYRALFKLFAEELMADTDHKPGQILYKNDTIYLRTTHTEE